MEFHQVRYFIALCTTLNFTRAAEACNVTQPALTRAIQRLEDELGGPLFQRERNLTQLTELGRLMRPHLEQALVAAETAKTHASAFRKTEVAALRLGLVPTVSPHVAVGPLPELIRRIPTLEIQLKLTEQRALIDELLQGGLDAGLMVDDGEIPDRMQTWQLFREGYAVACATSHRFAALETIPVAELAGEVVLGRAGCAATRALSQANTTGGTGPAVRHLADTEEQLQHLAAKSLGVLLVPRHLPVLPGLVTKPLSGTLPQRSVALAVVGGRRYSPSLDAFIRLSRARDFTAGLAA